MCTFFHPHLYPNDYSTDSSPPMSAFTRMPNRCCREQYVTPQPEHIYLKRRNTLVCLSTICLTVKTQTKILPVYCTRPVDLILHTSSGIHENRCHECIVSYNKTGDLLPVYHMICAFLLEHPASNC